MTRWQADLYRRPHQDSAGKPLWELLICSAAGDRLVRAAVPQALVSRDWLIPVLREAIATHGSPQQIQVFRPQSLGLLQTAATELGLTVVPERSTPALKAWLQELSAAFTDQTWVTVEQAPPQPLPDPVLGDRWRFATIAATALEAVFRDRPIPLVSAPAERLPLALGLASNQPIPGVIVEGGRRAMPLARWLMQQQPYALDYKPGAPDGVILEAGLDLRWVLATFEDPEVRSAGERFQERQALAQGLHFLMVQPDDTGVTTTGFWLLRRDP